MNDHVDFILEQWAVAMPDVNVSSMAVFGRMIRILKQVEKRREEALKSYGFKKGDFDVLATLRRSGEPYQLTPTELFNSLMITSGAISQRLTRLLDAGLVERIADASDKRSMLVALTDRGKELIEQAVYTHTEIQNQILAVLEPAQREQLASIMKTVLMTLPGEQNNR